MEEEHSADEREKTDGERERTAVSDAARHAGDERGAGGDAGGERGLKTAPNIHSGVPNRRGTPELSYTADERLDKGQEKSNLSKKVMSGVLTKTVKRGIFITLISTRQH